MTLHERKQYELTIATKFLRLLGAQWKVLDGDRESPDFLVTDGNEVCGLELRGYREQCIQNETQSHDESLRQFLRDYWLVNESLQSFALTLYYRMDGAGRFYMPRKNAFSQVALELKHLIEGIDSPTKEMTIDLSRDSDDCRAGTVATPTLDAHFRKIGLQYDPRMRFIYPHTSASARNTGADTEELARMLQAKGTKTNEYRANTPTGTGLWLLIHSDGWPMTAHVVNDIVMERLLTAARNDPHISRFDRAWWFDNAYVTPCGPLYEIPMATPSHNDGRNSPAILT